MYEAQSDRYGNTHSLCTTVALAVFLNEEDVDIQSRHRVEEGENTDSDEELSRGRAVSFEEQPFRLRTFTRGHIEPHLMESVCTQKE